MCRGRLGPVCFAALLGLGLLPGHSSALTPIRQGGEFQINRITFNNQYDASLALEADGDFVVVWTDAFIEATKGIFGALSNSAGVVQGNQFRINTYTPSSQHRSVVAMETNGDFVVVWQSLHQGGVTSNYTIFGQRFTSAGATVAVEFQVNQFTTIYSYLAKIASDADGDFVVVWESHNTQSADGSSSGVFARRFNSSGSALGGDFQANTYTQNFQGRPAVASDAEGDFVIVWYSSNQFGGSDDVFGKRFTSAGTVLGLEFRVNTFTSDVQQIPAVAVEADGDFVVVWQSLHQDGVFPTGNLGIFGRRFNSSGVGQGIEFMVNTYTVGYQRKPQIASNNSGVYVVSWESQGQDGSGPGLFARRINAGPPIGREFQVNTYTPNVQHQIHASASNGQGIDFSADGSFVVVWHDDNITPSRDGNAAGVFAQRFTLPPVAVLDVDANGVVAPFSDGLLVLKRLIGLTGANLVSGNLIAADCTPPRCDAAGVGAYIDSIDALLDVDDNGETTPFQDGLLILKSLIGLTGANLVSGNLIAGNCTPPRCDAAGVTDYINGLKTP